MTTTVEYKTQVINGKEYQLKITRQKGLQEVVLNGERVMVEEAAFVEWPGKMGTSKNYTVARKPKSPEEEAAFLARVREIATDGLIRQGIW